jgi:hypothetical protein
MAASTFAALFLAHVIADYLLQTRWMVDNKRHPLAMGLHIGAVWLTLPLVTLSLSTWFVALAGLHLLIDLTKTFVLRGGLIPYLVDQFLHLASIAVIVAMAPALWAGSPLAEVAGLPQVYLTVAVALFAARGGQFAIASRAGATRNPGSVHSGWAERALPVLAIAAGLPWLVGIVVLAKVAQLALAPARRGMDGRTHPWWDASLSMGWGLCCAAGLWAILPLLP